MGCSNYSPSWTVNLKVGLDQKSFVIQLNRFPKCCGPETYRLFVNDQEREHQLAYNNCSPYCGNGGSYEWEEDGHTFLLMLDKLSHADSLGKFRLFVDGIDVETGREFSDYWRKRGIMWLIIGLIELALLVIIYLVVFVGFQVSLRHIGSVSGLSVLLFWGIYHLIAAMMLFKRYSEPRAAPSAVQDFKAFQSAKIV